MRINERAHIYTRAIVLKPVCVCVCIIKGVAPKLMMVRAGPLAVSHQVRTYVRICVTLEG